MIDRTFDIMYDFINREMVRYLRGNILYIGVQTCFVVAW